MQRSAPNLKVRKATLLCEKVDVCAWMNSKCRCFKYNKGRIRGEQGPGVPGKSLSSLSTSPEKSQCTEEAAQSVPARQARVSLAWGLPPLGVSHRKSERERLIKAPSRWENRLHPREEQKLSRRRASGSEAGASLGKFERVFGPDNF